MGLLDQPKRQGNRLTMLSLVTALGAGLGSGAQAYLASQQTTTHEDAIATERVMAEAHAAEIRRVLERISDDLDQHEQRLNRVAELVAALKATDELLIHGNYHGAKRRAAELVVPAAAPVMMAPRRSFLAIDRVEPAPAEVAAQKAEMFGAPDEEPDG